MESIFAALGLGTLGSISAMAFLTMIIVEVMKNVIPKKFPTQILTLIIALIIAVIIPFLAPGVVISFATIAASVLNGFIIAFISMNGFDSLKKIWERMSGNKENGGDEDGSV